MSAAEIIEQIKALPREEQRRVFDFLKEAQQDSSPGTMRFGTDEQARAAGDAVVAQFPEVFRRLAE
jgi:hypothetical protein